MRTIQRPMTVSMDRTLKFLKIQKMRKMRIVRSKMMMEALVECGTIWAHELVKEQAQVPCRQRHGTIWAMCSPASALCVSSYSLPAGRS